MENKKIIRVLCALFLLFSLNSCYRVSPDAGQEAVLIYKPAIWGHGGVDDTPVSTGSIWCWETTDNVMFIITPQTDTESFVDMIPADNTPVSFHAYIKYQVRKGQSPELYKNFGVNWYANNLEPTFRTMVRDKASAYKMFDLASKRDVSKKLEDDIYTDICAYAKKINIPVDILQVTIGAITPPEQVLTETKNTAAQNQSILTQTARANAELARKQAEINKAIADQAYQQQMNMTIDQYMHLRQLEIEKEKVELIKDHQNVSIIFGTVSPTYNVSK